MKLCNKINDQKEVIDTHRNDTIRRIQPYGLYVKTRLIRLCNEMPYTISGTTLLSQSPLRIQYVINQFYIIKENPITYAHQDCHRLVTSIKRCALEHNLCANVIFLDCGTKTMRRARRTIHLENCLLLTYLQCKYFLYE